MIELFRKYTPANIFLLVVIGFALCIGAFIQLPKDLNPILFEPAIANLTGNIEPGLIPPARRASAISIATCSARPRGEVSASMRIEPRLCSAMLAAPT